MIHHVYANRSNAGDWLSAMGIQSCLEGLPVIEHLCDDPFVEETLDRLAEADPGTVVIGGGGLLMDYFTPFWEGVAALLDRHRFCVWGVGYCDLKLEPSRPPAELVRRVAEGADLFVVRDRHTEEVLGLPLSPPVPCPSLCALEPQPLGEAVLHCNNYTTVGPPAYEVMRRECTTFASKQGRPFEETNNRFEAGDRNALAGVLRRYERSAIVVSSALHGCIIGVAMGRPVIAVSGDHKIDSFMRAAGLGEWLLDVEEIDRLPDLLATVTAQPPVGGFVAATRERNYEIAHAVREIALSGPLRRAGSFPSS